MEHAQGAHAAVDAVYRSDWGRIVASLIRQVGDFDVADVLIEGSRIAAVGPNLTATGTIVDAANTIVMPGFIDTHRHMWQGALRNIQASRPTS